MGKSDTFLNNLGHLLGLKLPAMGMDEPTHVRIGDEAKRQCLGAVGDL